MGAPLGQAGCGAVQALQRHRRRAGGARGPTCHGHGAAGDRLARAANHVQRGQLLQELQVAACVAAPGGGLSRQASRARGWGCCCSSGKGSPRGAGATPPAWSAWRWVVSTPTSRARCWRAAHSTLSGSAGSTARALRCRSITLQQRGAVRERGAFTLVRVRERERASAPCACAGAGRAAAARASVREAHRHVPGSRQALRWLRRSSAGAHRYA